MSLFEALKSAIVIKAVPDAGVFVYWAGGQTINVVNKEGEYVAAHPWIRGDFSEENLTLEQAYDLVDRIAWHYECCTFSPATYEKARKARDVGWLIRYIETYHKQSNGIDALFEAFKPENKNLQEEGRV